jgi:hypothetical protein
VQDSSAMTVASVPRQYVLSVTQLPKESLISIKYASIAWLPSSGASQSI